jgi:hypothetical protein
MVSRKTRLQRPVSCHHDGAASESLVQGIMFERIVQLADLYDMLQDVILRRARTYS